MIAAVNWDLFKWFDPATAGAALGAVVIVLAWTFYFLRRLLRWLFPRCAECGGKLYADAEKDIGLCGPCLGVPWGQKGRGDGRDDDREKKKVRDLRRARSRKS